MKFKSNIEVQAGIEDKDGQVGSNGQILASTGIQVDWIDPANIVTSATDVIIECKNTSGVTIAKGTPVYQTGNVGATAVIEVAVADASDEDKMAAIGLLQSDLINNAFGYVVVTGELLNITTSPIDGVTPTIGDTIYVKPGGGLTLTKPTGVNFIQNVGLVGKVSGGNAGSITVSSIMRSNDVPTPLYIDHDNQRLGIGTASPGQKLDVDGSVNIDGTLFVNTNNNHIRLIDTDNTGNFSVGVNSNFQIRDITANTTPLTIRAGTPGNTILTTASGRVGIGLSSPGTTLHVGGFTRIDGGLQLNATNATIYQILDSALRFGTNNTERMRIDADGNVGIGTTSPDTRLEVVEASPTNGIVADFVNSTNAAGTTAAIKLSNADSEACDVVLGANRVGANFGSDFFISLSDSVDGSNQERFRITEAGNVGIGTTSPSEKLDVSGSANFSTDIIVGRNATALSFDMNPAYDSGNYYLKLHKNQSNDGGVLLYSKPTSGSAQLDWQIVNQGTTGDLKFYAAGLAGNALVLDRETGSLQLPEYGAGTLVSDASGNITVSSGGGAGGPYLPLAGGTMTGNIKGGNAVKLLLGAGDVFQLYNDGNGFLRNYTGNLYIDQNTDNGLITFRNDDGTGGIGNYLVLDGNTTHAYFSNPGNVGIGTTSPSTKLNISSASFNNHITLTRSTDELGISVSGGQLMFEGGVSPFNNNNEDLGRSDKYWKELFVYSVRSGGGLQFKTSGNNERMSITSAGNVGIGTTSPNHKLDIYSNENIPLRVHRPSNANLNSTGAWGIGFSTRGDANNSTTDTRAGIFSYYNGNLFLAANNSNIASSPISSARLTILNSGNVGIGITAPTSKLHINQNVTDPTLDLPSSFAVEIDSNHSGTTATGGDREQGGLYIDVDSSTTGGDITDEHRVYGVYSDVRHSGDSDRATGVYSIAEQNTTAGATTYVLGGEFVGVTDGGSSATVNTVAGVWGSASIQDATPLINSYGGYFRNSQATSRTGSTTSTYGLYTEVELNSDTTYTNIYGQRITLDVNTSGFTASRITLLDFNVTGLTDIPSATNTYAIHQPNDIKSYHEGDFGIGTTSPSSKLQVAGGIQMADDTDTASADKVGTMRYRTGTEYVEVTGTELITNGDFTTDSDWTLTANVAISGGKLNFTNAVTNTQYASQSISAPISSVYRITLDVSNLGSGESVKIRFPFQDTSINANGTYTIIGTGTTANAFRITPNSSTATFSIDNISVMEVTEEDASYADMCMQTGASTYEWVNIVRNTY